MAYKFFSQKLLEGSDKIDLSQVFPEKQEMAREQNNVTYTLLDIILFLRDRTENFKFADAQYVDLDNAIGEIINRYYKSKNEVNPFTKDVDMDALDEFKGEAPKEAFVAKDGEVKSKGQVKPAPASKKKSAEKPEEKVEKVVEEKVVVVDKVEKHKKSLEKYQDLIDTVFDEQETKELLDKLEKNRIGYEILDEPEYLEMAKLSEEFINKNSK